MGPGDDAPLEALVPRAAAGDEAAWREMWALLEPRLLGLVRKPSFLARLCEREDDCRNVVLDVLARLRADNFHRLHLYLKVRQENPNLPFMAWLIVVAKRVAVDYMRAHPEYIDRRRQKEAASTPGVWVEPGTLPTGSQLDGGRPPVTNMGASAAMMKFAAENFSPEQRQALEMWLQGIDYDEIAGKLGLGAAIEAERLVRAGLERLRRHFREEEK